MTTKDLQEHDFKLIDAGRKRGFNQGLSKAIEIIDEFKKQFSPFWLHKTNQYEVSEEDWEELKAKLGDELEDGK